MADRFVVDTRPTLSPAPGTYVLLLRSRQHAGVRVGAWGDLEIEPGWYLYVGSAFGPGGVRSRVLRHWRRRKPRHWHVDYLREYLRLAGAWYSYAPERLEHRWAIAFAGLPGMVPVAGFGCSDCTCRTHLCFTTQAPSRDEFIHAAGAGVPVQTWRRVV